MRGLRRLGLGFRLVGAPAVPLYDPTELFAGAQAGAWYDPSDLTTLYQTNDTSTPVTADAQSIGRISDKSGNGNHVTQATAGSRPVYKTSGGKSWIFNSDGTRQLGTAAMVTPWSVPLSIAVAGIIDTLASARGFHNNFVSALSSALYGNGFSHYFGQYYVDNKPYISSGTDQSLGSALSVATPYVAVLTSNGASTTIRINGVSNTVAGSPQTRDIETLYLGPLPTSSHGLLGKLYGVIVRDNVFSAGEITSVEAYLAAKVGASF